MATTPIAQNEMVVSPDMLPVKVTGIQSMSSKMWAPFLIMGFMIVAAALIIGIVNSSIAADYFAFSKVTREAAETGSTLATQKAFIESTKIWMPALKFFGVGTLLGGITFILATILGTLRVGGGGVQAAIGVEVRMPKPPVTAMLFPMVMAMGMMLLIAALIISIPTAILAYGYWNHSIANELNPAVEGSELLRQLGTINAIKLWLAPFKFVGMATLFTGIGLALATIVQVLRWQSNRLWNILS